MKKNFNSQPNDVLGFTEKKTCRKTFIRMPTNKTIIEKVQIKCQCTDDVNRKR